MAFLHRQIQKRGRSGTPSSPAQSSAQWRPPPVLGRPGSIDPELAFEAAVALALSSGAISRAGEAVRDASRFTDTSYVLMGPAGVTLKRISRAAIVAELERQARINGNLESYRLRFRPGRTTVMVAVFAGFSALLAMQAWVNAINERRIVALEQAYLDHQASLAAGPGGSATPGVQLATIETVGEFESRLLRTKFEGCYDEVKANLARATDQLKLAHQSGASGSAPLHLLDARRTYEEFKAAHRSCRGSLAGLFSGWFPS